MATNFLLTIIVQIHTFLMWNGKEETVRLADSYIAAVKKAGVEVYFADRRTTKTWNNSRGAGDMLQYGGWYWMRQEKGKITATDEDGPFRSQSAAIRDAYMKLQLRIWG